MISHEHQCIFVHIPKTAGNSVNRVFGIGWQDHKDLQRYRDELSPETFEGYFKFAIVRNPWERIFSDYNYQLKKSREKDSKLFLFTPGGSMRNFAEWVEVALAAPDYYEPQRWGGAVSDHIHRWSPQVDWISVDGRPAVDFIAHLDRLSYDFPVICRRLGLPRAHLPHRNRRLHLHYSHYYDAATRSLVAAYYARDIELFGYEFRQALLRVSFAWPAAHPPTADSDPASPAPAATVVPHAATRTYSFARERRARVRRAWLHRSAFALAASIAIFVRTFSAAPPADPDARLSMPQQLVRDSVRQVVAASLPSSRRGRTPLASVRNASRELQSFQVMLEPSPGAMLGFTAVVLTSPPESPPLVPHRYSAPPPAGFRSESGTAPRWWWNRRLDQ